jgi:hypothetical protein
VTVFLWGGWLAVPFIIGFVAVAVAVVIVLTVAEARARRRRASELFKETLKRMGRRSK